MKGGGVVSHYTVGHESRGEGRLQVYNVRAQWEGWGVTVAYITSRGMWEEVGDFLIQNWVAKWEGGEGNDYNKCGHGMGGETLQLHNFAHDIGGGRGGTFTLLTTVRARGNRGGGREITYNYYVAWRVRGMMGGNFHILHCSGEGREWGRGNTQLTTSAGGRGGGGGLGGDN